MNRPHHKKMTLKRNGGPKSRKKEKKINMGRKNRLLKQGDQNVFFMKIGGPKVHLSLYLIIWCKT
jgi:hypothetical protein